ncbi:MAG: pseudouridine synthase [Coriobacteriia bacterium]|nr:pseudouridine synthase [Coriobacteriia bacterium]
MEPVRLQRFMARAGVKSRRASEELIEQGRVSVNGEVVTKLGTKVDPAADVVEVDGQRIRMFEGEAYLVLHKPAGYITAMHDDHGKRCVSELVPAEDYPGLYPVGRLDSNTTGVLLFTTNGPLGDQLLHPSHHVLKQYLATVKGTPTRHQLHQLRTGVTIRAQGKVATTSPAEVELLEVGERALLRIGIREGRYHQVKLMCETVGHEVLKLHREAFGPVRVDDLPEGAWRLCTEQEVSALKRAAEE